MIGSAEAAASQPVETHRGDQSRETERTKLSMADALGSVVPFAWPVVVLIVFATLHGPLGTALRAVSQRLTQMHSLKAGSLEIVVNEATLPLVPPIVARAIAGLSPGEVEKLLKHSYEDCKRQPPPSFELMGIVKKQSKLCATITDDIGKPTRAYLFRLVAVEVASAPEPIDPTDRLVGEEQ